MWLNKRMTRAVLTETSGCSPALGLFFFREAAMALSITNITRVGAAGCQHYDITINEDGVPRTIRIHRDEVTRRDAWQEYGPKAALVLLWARYKLEGGATLAQLANVAIA